jgi:hypothetical protein
MAQKAALNIGLVLANRWPFSASFFLSNHSEKDQAAGILRITLCTLKSQTLCREISDCLIQAWLGDPEIIARVSINPQDRNSGSCVAVQ